MANTVLFYFWTHGKDNLEGLDTENFRELIPRAKVLLAEQVIMDLNRIEIEEFETKVNAYLNDPHLYFNLFDLQLRKCFNYLFFNMRDKRIVFERTPPPIFDFNAVLNSPFREFFKNESLTNIRKLANECFKQINDYNREREEGVSKQILTIEEPVIVLFGVGHRDLAKIVKENRPVEIHYPFSDYQIPYMVLLTDSFRETGEVNMEYFLKEIANRMIRKTLKLRYWDIPYRDNIKLSYKYADLLTEGQIIAYRDRIVGLSNADLLKSFAEFLEKENLPQPEELLGREICGNYFI